MLLLIDDILGLLSPHICKGCGQIGSTYCSRCIFNMTKRNYPICLTCGKPCKTNNLCPACRKRNNFFADLHCLGERTGELLHLVGDYKYNSEVASCRVLARLVANRMTTLPPDLVIVPIPTIAAHIRQRGFDHMLLLARQLGRLTNRPVNNKILHRTNNISQHRLNLRDRRELIRGSLAVYDQSPAPSRVLLLDDIWTTGSTMKTAAELLHQAGVSDVVGCVIVKQPHH